MKDPKCEDLEEECKEEKVEAASKVVAAEKNLNDTKAKMQEAKDNWKIVKANAPQECKK